jgi:hypothetical protein
MDGYLGWALYLLSPDGADPARPPHHGAYGGPSTRGGFGDNGTVTELSAGTGRLVHLFTARRYHFDHPFAIAAWHGQVWVLNRHSVTKL